MGQEQKKSCLSFKWRTPNANEAVCGRIYNLGAGDTREKLLTWRKIAFLDEKLGVFLSQKMVS